MASDTQQGSSTSAFVSSLILNLVLLVVFVGLFVLLKNKETRVYSPRNTVPTVPKEKQPDESPKGAFAWINHLLKKPESWIIQQAGVDGYFFLRYIFFFSTICFITGLVILPILLPINAANGKGGKGFDIISFSNVGNKNRFFAHVFCSWIFFGGIIFGIYRELYYYVSFRHAYQTTPYIESLISTKTLLITSLPKELIDDESQVKALFPAATSITFARDYKDLTKDVKERTKLSNKYEAALNKVINKSVKIHTKLVKKNKEIPEKTDELESFIPEKKQPHYKLKPIIGEKVNTIDYANTHLPELNEKIKTQQDDYLNAKAIDSVFLEFPTQLELQRALQAVKFYKPFKKSGSQTVINATPDEIVWDNLGNSYVTRLLKKTGAVTLLTLMIIFWAIPVAVVGCISNINYLTEKVHFLKFINKMPSSLMGIITGLLPTILLAVLMSLVPPFIKFMGKVSGLQTQQKIDLWCQDWYYAFQVIQVFLVTTCASAATSAVTQIIDDPSSAMSLLAENLPKASNFYIAYILLQGLTIPGGALLQIVALILSKVLGRVLDNTPRKKWNRFNSLSQPSWGVVYPVYSLIGVITICYATIAPIIIAFAVVAFTLVYFAYLYNLVYVLNNSMDSRGRNFAKAMFQIFVALYLAEICLIGLFVLAKTWGPFALEIVMLIFTIAAHLYLKWRFIPLYDEIPVSGIYKAQNENVDYPHVNQGRKEIVSTGKDFWENASSANYENKDDESSDKGTAGTSIGVTGGAEGITDETPVNRTPSVGAFKRFFKPTTYLNLMEVKKHLPSYLNTPISYTPEQVEANKYLHPSVKDEESNFWIVEDNLGLSKTLISKSNGLLVTDKNTTLDDKGKPNYTGPPPDYEEAIKV